ncbi:GrpB family protein [Crossiella sp. NPDC003009]
MSKPLDDAALAAVLLRPLQPAQVTLAEYDPDWPRRYARRAGELREALGDRLLSVDHIGSTSVPGLAAKPVVDIMVSVADPEDEAAYLAELTALGYRLSAREPGHRCLRGFDPEEPVNLHVYAPGHVELARCLAFRDRLRASAADRERYEAVKRELARREWRDMNYYAEAKRPVIFEILAAAGWQEPAES